MDFFVKVPALEPSAEAKPFDDVAFDVFRCWKILALGLTVARSVSVKLRHSFPEFCFIDEFIRGNSARLVKCGERISCIYFLGM